MSRAPVPVAVLISGRGSNLQALVHASANGAPFAVSLVVSNVPDAPGLQRAAAAGIPHMTVDHRPFGKDRPAFEAALDQELRAHGVELVALAGFMRVLTPWFVGRWRGRLINIHPSLLPSFKGLDTHARALAAGVKVHGCTVHFVSDGVDEGQIIGQAAVPVRPDDTPDTLAERVLAAEHTLYPVCLALVAQGAGGQVLGFGPPDGTPPLAVGFLPS